MQKLTYPLLLLILLAGLTLRVWDINFDQGLGTHPDERSTACGYAPRIHLPTSWDEFWDPHRSPLNPLWNVNEQKREGFTYGHFPLYLGVAMANLFHAVAPVAEQLHFPKAALAIMANADKDCAGIAVAGRLVIALLDTLTIFLLFLLGRRLFNSATGLLAAAFYAFTAQAVQLSHFFAMDPASTTFSVLAVLGGVKMVQDRTLRAAVLTGLAAGLAVSSKFSAIPILLTPFVAAVLAFWTDAQRSRQEGRPTDGRAQFTALVGAPLALIVAIVAFFVSSPYAVLDWKSFLDATLVGQGRMVRGIADFPFTRQYRNTTPYVYFIDQQLRWGIGWALGAVAALGTVYALVMLLVSLYRLVYSWFAQSFDRASRKWLSDAEVSNVVIWSWVLPYFGLTGAFMAKFNRYMSPVLPFVMLFAAWLIARLWTGLKGQGAESKGLGAEDRGQRSEVRRQKAEGWQAEQLSVEAITPHIQQDWDEGADGLTPRVGAAPRPRWVTVLARTVAVLLAVVGIGGGLFWTVAFVNGVYNHEHTWITASRWMYQNIPKGSKILWELWDDPLPKSVPNEPGMDMGTKGLANIDWSPYEEDTADKYALMKQKLREADYVAYSSKRIYGSVRVLPERYPMTTRYYDAMWDGSLGFQMVLDQTSPPRLFGFVFDDRHADESWSLYDHPQVTVFKKVRNLSDAEYDAVFDHLWEKAQHGYVGKGSALNPWLNLVGLGSSQESENRGLINRVINLIMGDDNAPPPAPEDRPSLMLSKPLAQLPVVDNYRWNTRASESVPLAIFWWWLVLALLGWAVWPLAFVLFKPLRDRGYLLSRALGWLLGGWLLWWLASIGLAQNTVANAWLTVGVLFLGGLCVVIWHWAEMRTFLRTHWPLLLASELLFAVAYLAFVWIRMGNPDLWQPWFGGEKFMEFAFLNGILRSPTFPPVDPHFAGGFINYYYFGIYLVAYLIKLTGIYAEVAFNLAIPALFALTVVNVFSVAYSAVGRGEQGARGKGQGFDASVRLSGSTEFTEVRTVSDSTESSAELTRSVVEVSAERKESNEQGAGSVAFLEEQGAERNEQGGEFRPPPSALRPLPWYSGFGTALLAPLFVVVIGNLDGFAQIVRELAKLSDKHFQSTFSSVETLVNAFYGLQLVLAHKQTLPNYDFWGPSRVLPSTINEFPYWSFLFADLHAHLIAIPLAAFFLALALTLISDYAVDWRRSWGRGLALLATFALVLGALASNNLWELPTYFGLGVLALMISQYRGKGRINWLLLIGVTLAYLGGAYLLFRPFFHNYKNIGASGVGLVKEGDDLGTWLLIWGFMAFMLFSWLIYIAAQPARSRVTVGATALDARPTGCERWLSLALRQFDRLPRFLYLHRLLVQPRVSYLLGLALLPLSLFASAGSLIWQRSVLALCLLFLGLAVLLLWRRGRQAVPANLFVALLTATGLAVLAGTQVIYLKDFLAGGDWYRMNTLFKFFSQVWVLWGVAAAIAVPQVWRGFITGQTATSRVQVAAENESTGSDAFSRSSATTTEVVTTDANAPTRPKRSWGRGLVRFAWGVLFILLLAVSLAYLVWGTPARLDMRMVGWRPPFGTLNGLDYMLQGSYTLPNTNTPVELKYDHEVIEWILQHVRGNTVVVESADLEYYRAGGSRLASLTGLSGVTGMHEGEQRYGEDTGARDQLLHEFWSTPDVNRTTQLLDQLHVALVYAGQLEKDRSPDGVRKLEQMAANGLLTPLFQNERSVLYLVPGKLVQMAPGIYVPK